MLTVLKIALSLNGFLDDGKEERSVISNSIDRSAVSLLRARSDAILIGGETFRKDNPSLLIYQNEDRINRLKTWETPDPVPVILWGGTKTPENFNTYKLFQKSIKQENNFERKVIVIASEKLSSEMKILPQNIKIHYYSGEMASLPFIYKVLSEEKISRLLVEGSNFLVPIFLENSNADLIRIAYRGISFNKENAKGIFPESDISFSDSYTLCKLENLSNHNIDSMHAIWFRKKESSSNTDVFLDEVSRLN
ncbi:MAG TPA: dihydrofolate reductase family protein [Oligoflexia bacterium]|nr:dihydrofolate reductase family protein [Oligoflexia bacterium]HMP49561.1 dihydrofolate reductase family protein [Oligoflexia bacterium]